MSVTGSPRKLIWVRGPAVSVSGAGDTSTEVPGSVALCSSVAGRQVGEAPLGVITVWAEDSAPVPRTIATATQATAATSRTMYPFLLMCGLTTEERTIPWRCHASLRMGARPGAYLRHA